MKFIILNSGLGSRLGDLTRNNPKSLVKITTNQTIFSRAVNILSSYSKDFIITTGYLNNVLVDYINTNFSDLNFTFVHNPVYDKTNYIKSLDLIDDIDDDFVLLHGDLVFSKQVANDIINSNNSSVVIDSSIDLPKDDFKAKIVDNKVKFISTKYFDLFYLKKSMIRNKQSDKLDELLNAYGIDKLDDNYMKWMEIVDKGLF